MLDVDQLLEATATDVGLADYGDPSFREGLDLLVATAEAEAQLSDFGRLVLQGSIAEALANRLRVVDWTTRHPDLADEVVAAPLFIVGQPRTGTTALSHLLAADPANRSLLGWEARQSVPPPTTATYATDPRFEAARAAPNLLADRNPDFKTMHHDEAHEPIECIVMLNQTFASLQFSAMFHIPTYDRWLGETDLVPSYRYHRQVLQLLQSEHPGRWQLKSPHHQLGIDAITTVYPDARLVWTHRDPISVIGSLCSVTCSLTGTFTDADLRLAIAEHWFEEAAVMADRMLAHRDRAGDAAFHDMSYRELVTDPVAATAELYQRFDMAFTAEAEAAMRAHVAASPQGKHGAHRYTLDDFGLDEAQVGERFAAYLDRFGELV
ncbi:MAG: hypothetical protein JWN67_1161 [Actinomycetia bacterium]|nr:hypothetical protein [Actinomycetes bacterium]